MKYSVVLTVAAFAISSANATLSLSGLTSLFNCGGSSSGTNGSTDTSTTTATPCETVVTTQECNECEQQGSATGSYDQSSSSTSEVPTDMMSQMIGGLSNIIETTFSGSGSMLHNLIG